MHRFAVHVRRGGSLSVLVWSTAGGQAAPRAQPPRADDPAGTRAAPGWPLPPGWQHETFALSPAFAPQLPYHGTEQLRFMPGFYAARAADFWSYDLVWWLAQPPAFDAAAVSTALTAYFRGLSAQVGGAKYHFDPARFRTVLTPVPGAAPARLTGQVFTYDPFTTGQPITLHVEAEQRRCPSAGHTAIVVALSPTPPTDRVWTQLRTAAAALVCH